MARITKPAGRPRRAKAEVEQEFAEVQREVAAARETADPKAEEAARLRAAEVRQSVEGFSVEAVVQKVSALGLDVSRALAEVSDKLVEEVRNLAAVREAVALERQELERLHKIDVAAAALDQMVQDYGRQKEQLEAGIAAQRDTWAEEARAAERERKEAEDALKKQRQREIDDYEYKKVLERKKAQDKYDEEMRLQEKANREKQEALEKRWQERETNLKQQEQELARLRKEAEEFPARLEREAKQAAAEAARAAQQQYEQQIAFLKKDGETEKRLSEMRIKTLEEVVARQAAQVAALEAQVVDAKRQVQDIAVKAIEGASGARALSHINEIAMEQAKHRSPQG